MVAELVMQDLASTVLAWMKYERLCGRNSILIERTLAYPICGYVIGRGQHVSPEVPVPGRKPGTKPRIDYGFQEKKNGPVTTFMETKLNSLQIVGDLVRLLGLQGRRYFLYAQTDYVGKAKVELQSTELLSTSLREPTRNIQEDSASVWRDVRAAYAEWLESLADPVPMREFRTCLVGFDEHPAQEPDTMVAIWEIGSSS